MGQSASKEAVSDADAADASKSRTATAAAAAEAPQQQRRQPDKLGDGPCAQIFEQLDKCAGAKGITKHAVSWKSKINETKVSRRYLVFSLSLSHHIYIYIYYNIISNLTPPPSYQIVGKASSMSNRNR